MKRTGKRGRNEDCILQGNHALSWKWGVEGWGREEWLLSFKNLLYISRENSKIQICVLLYAPF